MKNLVSWIVLAAALAALVGAVYIARNDDAAWEKFRTEHRCRPVDQQRAPEGVGTTPGKATWLCDDGNVYQHGMD